MSEFKPPSDTGYKTPICKPPMRTKLAARTAEALALPQLACRYRSCRRGQRCRFHFKKSGEPVCLRNLTAEARAEFDRVYEAAHVAKGFLGSDPQMFESREGPRRVLDDLAIAIARNFGERWRPEIWDAARRAREKRMRAWDARAAAGGMSGSGRQAGATGPADRRGASE